MGEVDLVPVLNIIQSRKLLHHWQRKGKDYIRNKVYCVNIYAVVGKYYVTQMWNFLKFQD